MVLINRWKTGRFRIVKCDIVHVLAPPACADIYLLRILYFALLLRLLFIQFVDLFCF